MNTQTKKWVTVQLSEVSVGVIASPFRGEAIPFKIASSLSLLAMTRLLLRAELLQKWLLVFSSIALLCLNPAKAFGYTLSLAPNQRAEVYYTNSAEHYTNTLRVTVDGVVTNGPFSPAILIGGPIGSTVIIDDWVKESGTTAKEQAGSPAGSDPEVTTIRYEDGAVSPADWNDITVTLNKYPAPTYKLTTNISPPGGGTVSGGGAYTSGATVTVTANPAGGWDFSKFTGDLSGTSSRGQVYMNGDKTVTANFTAMCTLTLTPSPSNAGQVAGGGSYPYGSVVDIYAYPNTGSIFTGWSGDYSGSAAHAQIGITKTPMNITANFMRQYSLTVNISPTGVGSAGKVELNPAGGTYDDGSTVTLTAVGGKMGDFPYAFNHWSGGLSGNKNPEEITMTGNKTITANFVSGRNLTVLIEPEGVGTVSGADNYKRGALVKLTATPISGYHCSQWREGQNILATNTNTYNVTMDRDHTITAYFVKEVFCKLTADVDPAGDPVSGSVSGIKDSYRLGETATVTAKENQGFQFSYWSEGDTSLGTNNPLTLNMDTNHNITAHFRRKWCNLTINIKPPEGGKVNQEGPNPNNGIVYLTPVANSGYAFNNWIINGEPPSYEDVYDHGIQVCLDQDRIVNATFSQGYTLDIKAEHGKVKKDPAPNNYGYYAENTQVILSAKADKGYAFKSWEWDLTGNKNPDKITMSGQDRKKIVKVNFVKQYTLTVKVLKGEGTVTKEPDKVQFDEGEQVKLTATPTSGYMFMCWAKDLSGGRDPETITMNADKEVHAIFAPQPGVDVYCLQNSSDSIILSDNEYPEVMFLTLFAVETDENGKQKLYDGSRGAVSFKIDLGPACSYAILKMLNMDKLDVNLAHLYNNIFTEDGTLDLNNFNFYKALAGASELDVIKAARPFQWENSVSKTYALGSKGYLVIGIFSRNFFSEEISNLIPTITGSGGVPINHINLNGDFKINIDNVGFVREKVPDYFAAQLAKFIGDPGKFVVTGSDGRTYDDILQMKLEEANGRGNVSLAGDGVPDWIEVAVAELYNTNNTNNATRKNIWRISMGNSGLASVSNLNPNTLMIDSYLCPALRFNDESRSGHGFTHKKTRDDIFGWHEPHHSFQFYNQNFLNHQYDFDTDYHVAAEPERSSPHPYFKFAWDHKDRGFVVPMEDGIGSAESKLIRGYYFGEPTIKWGDKEKYPNDHTAVVVNCISSLLSQSELENIINGNSVTLQKTLSSVPADFPFECVGVSLRGLWLYKPEESALEENDPLLRAGICQQININKDALNIIESQMGQKDGAAGYYTPASFSLSIKGAIGDPILLFYKQKILSGKTRLYAVLDICPRKTMGGGIPPFFEYDAENYAVFIHD